MMSFLTSESGMAALSIVGGWLMRYQTEKNKRFFDVLAAKDKSMDAAARRDKDGGTWMRRAIYGLVALSYVAVLVAGFLAIPVVHEVVTEKSAFLVLKKTVTEFVTTTGVFFPPETRKGFLMLCGFYLGQGVK